MKKLSFIIPMYNAEQYIIRCITALKNQDKKLLDQCEFIFVDDASKDNSAEMVKREMPEAIVIKHTENKRQGGARNTGLRHATGEYVWFVDVDDEIAKNSLSHFFNITKNDNFDAVFFGAITVDESGKYISKTYFTCGKTLSSGVDFLLSHKKPRGPIFIFNRNFLLKNKIFFEEHVLFEDSGFQTLVMLSAKRIIFIPEIFYIAHHILSSSSNPITKQKCIDLSKSYNYQYAIAKKEKLKLKPSLYYYAMMTFNSLMFAYKRLPKQEKNSLDLLKEISKFKIIFTAICSCYPKYILESIYLLLFWNTIFNKK